jgi:hypothetical protein
MVAQGTITWVGKKTIAKREERSLYTVSQAISRY